MTTYTYLRTGNYQDGDKIRCDRCDAEGKYLCEDCVTRRAES